MFSSKLKWLGMLLTALLLAAQVVQAQQIRITGVVTDTQNEPLPGATVVVKGTNRGTITDGEGKYAIQAASGKVLVFSFVGFESVERTIGNSNTVSVSLSEGVALSEVVVTALGIKREEKALGYATQKIGSEDLLEARSNNWSDALRGKVAGLNVLSAGSGPMNSSQHGYRIAQ